MNGVSTLILTRCGARSGSGRPGVGRLPLLLAYLLLTATAWADEPRIRAVDAIGMTVSDMDRSVDFYASLLGYRDRLGFRVAGGSENSGPEQERLNAVRGAHLRITSLRAVDGRGIEFLEYLTPRTGRPFPAGERANDLVHWQTRLVARDGAALGSLGPHPVAIPGHELGFAHGITVRDPDGHSLEVVEP